jgi:hypothetical protein
VSLGLVRCICTILLLWVPTLVANPWAVAQQGGAVSTQAQGLSVPVIPLAADKQPSPAEPSKPPAAAAGTFPTVDAHP